jgi:hypothetical protein
MGGVCREVKRTGFRWREVITWNTKVLAGRLVLKLVLKETSLERNKSEGYGVASCR